MNALKKEKELTGELLVFGSSVLNAVFPIVINSGGRVLPPILFAAISNLIPAMFLFFYLFFTNNLKSLFNKKSLFYLLNIAVFVVILPLLFIFIGTTHTSGINTGIFLNTEIIFAFIICRIVLKEKFVLRKILGAAVITLGAFVVLYNGHLAFNIGDLLIIAGTAFYPIGNIFGKKALEFLKPCQILFARSLIGGSVLLSISFIFEKSFTMPAEMLILNYKYILINAILIFLVSKLLWYYGLKLVDVVKATSIIIATPAFSLIFAYVFLHEIPSIYQLLGCILIIIGLIVSSVMFKKINKYLTKNSSLLKNC